MSDSCVKVGIRIRPLTAKEKHQNVVLNNYDKVSIQFKNQTYTYDYVFGSEYNQQQLYQSTAAPMLRSFLEGYNVTIMAYGQTGSGKTYTMGTSGDGVFESDAQGLLPRFLSDLFENLRDLAAGGADGTERVESTVRVSFLEIYGEDVYDLSMAAISNRGGSNLERPSLPVRENDGGMVFVQGLQEAVVQSAREALDLLYQGSQNRTTGSTAMNAGSSRSHAVFTITLDQRVLSSDSEDDVQIMTSKLTFVDLAGSERLKRTGAEGQRMKEGIQINSGLFNLGQVINGLADDQRLKNGNKAQHIPYRNSKLTHLLKDALGGNSKTLFLACVSPAEMNESETNSTLLYARQARNIQNKPVLNMDKTQVQMRRLKCTAKTWMIKALTLMFGNGQTSSSAFSALSPVREGGRMAISPLPRGLGMGVLSPAGRVSTGQYVNLCGGAAEDDSHTISELLARPEVQKYIESVEEAISQSLNQTVQPSPRKVRLSLNVSTPSSRAFVPRRFPVNDAAAPSLPLHTPDAVTGAVGGGMPRAALNFGDGDAPIAKAPDSADHHAVVPLLDEAETEKLLNRMFEMVSKEKEQVWSSSAADEEGAGAGPSVLDVEKEIEEKEAILIKLTDTLKGYSAMKVEYEKLMDEINMLDTERRELEAALDRATSSKKQDSTSTKHLEKLQDRFKKVNEELQQMRNERSRKEAAYKLMQKESKQYEQLSKDLQTLKENKVQLQKKQREQAQMYIKFKKEQQAKMQQLKKSDVKKQQLMNELKSELQKKQRVLGHKEREIGRMQSKLKACEEHITQLLRIQNRSNNTSGATHHHQGRSRSSVEVKSKSGQDEESNPLRPFGSNMSAMEWDHYLSSKNILENVVVDRAEKKELMASYETKSQLIRDLNSELVDEGIDLKTLTASLQDLQAQFDARMAEVEQQRQSAMLMSPGTPLPEDLAAMKAELTQLEQDVQQNEANIDRISREIDLFTNDLQEITSKLGRLGGAETSSPWDEMGKSIISGLNHAQCQTALWDLLAEKTELQIKVNNLLDSIKQSSGNAAASEERADSLSKQVDNLREELRVQLQAAESKRINDIWAIVKAQDGGSESGKELIQNAVLDHARELENAVNVCLASEERLKTEIAEYKQRVFALESEAVSSKLRIASAAGEASGLADDDSLRSLSEALKGTWDTLGVSVADRTAVLKRIENARVTAHEQAYHDVKELLLLSQEHQNVLKIEISQLVYILARENEGIDVDKICEKNEFVLERVRALFSLRNSMLRELATAFGRCDSMQSRVSAVIEELELDASDAVIVSHELVTLTSMQRFPQLSCAIESMPPASDVSLSPSDESFVDAFLNHLSSLNVVINEGTIQKWQAGLRQLNIMRANTLSKCETLCAEALSLCLALGFSTAAQLTRVFDSEAAEMHGALALVFSEPASRTLRGSVKVAAALERIVIALKSMKINRESIFKIILKFGLQWNDSIYSNGSTIASAAEFDESKAVHDRDAMQRVFQEVTRASADVQATSTRLLEGINAIVLDLSLSSEDIVAREAAIEAALLKLSRSKGAGDWKAAAAIKGEEASVTKVWERLKQLGACVAELEEVVMFADEDWLRDSAQGLAKTWSTHRQEISRAIVRQMELTRLGAVEGAVRELRRVDGQLNKHIRDMEDFETTSKQNRSKLLSGNSKALVEEEKFRKLGKKKYEHITEKLVAAYVQVLGALPPSSAKYDALVTSPTLSLSVTAQSAIKAKGKLTEKTELMHLHTTTHVPRQASSDASEDSDLPPPPPASSTALPSSAASVASSSCSSSSASAASSRPLPATTTNVFSNITSSTSATSSSTASSSSTSGSSSSSLLQRKASKDGGVFAQCLAAAPSSSSSSVGGSSVNSSGSSVSSTSGVGKASVTELFQRAGSSSSLSGSRNVNIENSNPQL